MSSSQQIARNAAWLVVATTLNKALAFVSFTILAWLVGPRIIGTFFYSVSVTSVAVVLADIGMTPVVIRAIAGNKEEGNRLLGATLRVKALLIPVAVLVALGYGVVVGNDTQTIATIAIACLVMSADTIHLALYGALRGKQNLRPEAMGMFIGQIFTSVFSITIAYLGAGPIGLAAGLLLGSTWNVIWAIGKSRQHGVQISKPRAADYRQLLREATPFAIAGIAVKLYSYVDSLLIQAYHGSLAVGMYAVAYKMTYATQFLPLTFTAALYPALATAWAEKDHVRLRQNFLGSMRFLAAVAFPIAAGFSALSPRLIPLLYGKAYLGAIPAFEILPWVLIPIFLDFPIGALLNGTHRAHLKTMAMVGTMVVNVFCNVLLVPSMGPLGAAWAAIMSFAVLVGMGLFFVRRDVGHWTEPVWLLIRTIGAAAVSWFAWRIIGDHMPLFAAMIFGGAVALCAGFVTRLLTFADFRWVASLRKREKISDEEPHAES